MGRIDEWFAIGKSPDVFVERAEFLLHLDESLGIGNHCPNLPRRTDYAFGVHYPLDIIVSKGGNLGGIEVGKAPAEHFTTLQHHLPWQSARHRLHKKVHEVVAVVVDWRTPFVVVIGYINKVIGKVTATDRVLHVAHGMTAPRCLADYPEAKPLIKALSPRMGMVDEQAKRKGILPCPL